MSSSNLSSLQLRIISALILAPIAVGAVYLGGIWFCLFLAISVAGMSWEWCKTSFQHHKSSYTFLVSIWLVVALYFAFEGFLQASLLGVIVASVALFGLTWFRKEEREWKGGFLGPIYIGIPAICLLELRGIEDVGMYWTLALFLIVWATDIGAYFVGRGVGGPKIAKVISPNKTWAGLIGGALCAGLTSILVNEYLLVMPIPAMTLAISGALIAVLAQAGDFTESGWKRHFDIKDASNLIPGHGGVLDRLDGVLFAAPALYFLQNAVGS